MQLAYLSCVRDSVICDARLPCAHTSRCFSSFTSRAGHRYRAGRIEHVVRVCVYIRILLLLILKSRALTTITQHIERDVKKFGIMQQYSGSPGVKSNFRDYPSSGRVGRSGVDVYLGATGTAICPVHALWAYLEKRGPSPGPLFLFHSGIPLTRAASVDLLQLLVPPRYAELVEVSQC